MIEFILNNEIVKTDVKSGMTLLHFIREIAGLKGTKSGCKEGDCGACTVLLGTYQDDGNVTYKSVTSCLTPMANVKNKHVVTIEGLNLKDELNISQLAIKEHYGTQCGFCTPGFVVSLSGYALDNDIKASPIEHISGNICRCTGYKSIEKAAATIEEKLINKNINDNLNWLIENRFVPEYFKAIPGKLSSLNSSALKNGKQLVGGGSDLYVRYADKLSEENIIPKDNIVSNAISFDENTFTLNAGVTVSDIEDNTHFNSFFPKLKEHLKLVSSKQIRNMGTIAGNFVNASPIGDMSIFFLALDSKLKLKNTGGNTRDIFLRDFFKDYKSFDLKKNEIISEISFNLPSENWHFNFEKVSKRTHLDIASVNSAMSIVVENMEIKDINVSIGGVSAIPKYLFETRAFLIHKVLSNQLITDAEKVMQKEISPISDIRGTDKYKRLLARQLFFAHFIELFPNKFELSGLIKNH